MANETKKPKAVKLVHFPLVVNPKYAVIPGGLGEIDITDSPSFELINEILTETLDSFINQIRFILVYSHDGSDRDIYIQASLIQPLKYKKENGKHILVFKAQKMLHIIKEKPTFAELIQFNSAIPYNLLEKFANDSRFEPFKVKVVADIDKRMPKPSEIDEISKTLELLISSLEAAEKDPMTGIAEQSIFLPNPNTGGVNRIRHIHSLLKEFEPNALGGTTDVDVYTRFVTYINLFNPILIPSKETIAFDDSCEAPLMLVFGDITQYLTKYMEVENKIKDDINQKLNDQQKEFILREKLRTIQNTLEKMNVPVNEDEYQKTIKNPKLSQIYPKSVQNLIESETKRVSEMMQASPEATLAKTYIDIMKKLPWRKTEKEFLDIKHARKVLDNNHYGLDKVKERIVEYLAVIINQKLKNKAENDAKLINIDDQYQIDLNLFKEGDNAKKRTFNNVPIITLVGPPGTGKTSLSKAIAEALNRKFIKVSLGGVHDESEIRGHRRTYVGAMPGKIIKGINQAGVSNPVILLDEIDKMKSDMKGDPASAMLEVLDPEQNIKFQDHYLEHEYDLSKAIFIATANYYESIPEPLLDRVEIIELSSYTLSEKLNIAKKHLIPKVLEQTALDKKYFKMSDETIEFIIKHYTKEAGVRGLKRLFDKIARKVVVKLMENPKMKSQEIKPEDIPNYLGVIQFKDEEKEEISIPGIVNGLAYTSYGGSTLQIEVNTFPGKPEIKLTGSLKEVMQESAQIALSYVRSNAEKFGINDFDFENNTIHIHVPEGAVPKDGPSAGVTFTTALISALSKKPVPSNIGMTGEITLRGKVLEIGGLKEKSFAASQKGLKYIFIPAGNVKNIQDVPNEIKCTLNYIPVYEYSEIFDFIFLNKQPKEILSFECDAKK
ncbi:endopeptidase La [Mycoplasma hafezii]|uniref:endopeptidase La n=1 Tax=Mycoplasma hafezii TaxID=525886 RepID=UPI003CE8309D